MKTATGGMQPPNRLTDAAVRRYRACAPLVRYLADARGVQPSRMSKEFSGERRSVVAEMDHLLGVLARGRKTDPGPLLAHFHHVVAREMAEKPTYGREAHLFRLIEDHQGARAKAELQLLRLSVAHCEETLAAAAEAVADEAAKTITLGAYLAVLQEAGA
jgi:hypothetical protein